MTDHHDSCVANEPQYSNTTVLYEMLKGQRLRMTASSALRFTESYLLLFLTSFGSGKIFMLPTQFLYYC